MAVRDREFIAVGIGAMWLFLQFWRIHGFMLVT